jgi:drug/metabolite transporter (DMT)-like permease
MPLFTYSSLVLVMLLWGGTFIAGRILATAMEPASAAFLRFAIASLAMLAAAPLLEGRLRPPPRRLWLPLFLLGLSGIFAYNVFFFNGLQHIGAGRASLIVAGTPLAINIFAALFLRERLTAMKGGGILLSLAGAVIVIGNGDPAALFHGGFGRGEQALVGCVLSWSAYSLIGRQVLQTLPPLTAVCYSALIGTLLLAIPAGHEGIFTRLGDIAPLSWLSLAFLGLGGTALAFSLYYMAIKKIGAGRAGIFINLVPVFSLLLAWLLLGETIKAEVLAGGLLVLAGVFMANVVRR